MTKRKLGSALAGLSYVLIFVGMVLSHVTAEVRHQPMQEMSEYMAPWPMHLLLSLVIVELYLCCVPLRAGERWAFWLALVPLVLMAATRLAHDPRCLGSLHVHGCHTFLLAVVLGFVGLGMVRFSKL